LADDGEKLAVVFYEPLEGEFGVRKEPVMEEKTMKEFEIITVMRKIIPLDPSRVASIWINIVFTTPKLTCCFKGTLEEVVVE